MNYLKNHNVPLVSELETSNRWRTFTFADINEPSSSYALQYVKEVSKGLRHAYKFACSSNTDEESRYFIYDPNDIYVMGWLGYGDYSLSREGPLKYVVYATNISNNKYDVYRQHHHMRMSENVSTAVRNAKRHLLPVAHEEIVKRTLNDTRDKIGDFVSDAKRQLRVELDKLGVNNTVSVCKKSHAWIELCHKLDIDQSFLSAECKDTLVKARRFMKTIDERESVPINMYCVRVYERLGEQTFNVVLIPNLPNAYNSYLSIDKLFGNQKYRVETLPEEIMSKMAVLSVCDVGDFIEDVGHRNMETLYYVYA